MLPGPLRLVDYGLHHDGRAKEIQPVASRIGPGFYGWQFGQDPPGSWRGCELHARNLPGELKIQLLQGSIKELQKAPGLVVQDTHESNRPITLEQGAHF